MRGRPRGPAVQRGFGFGAVAAVAIAWFDDGGGVAAP